MLALLIGHSYWISMTVFCSHSPSIPGLTSFKRPAFLVRSLDLISVPYDLFPRIGN